MQHDGKIQCELGDRRRLGIERILATSLTGDVGQTCQERLGPRLMKYFLFFRILAEREQKADDEQSVTSVEHSSRKQWQKGAKSVTAQKQVSQSRYSQRYSLESQCNFSRIQVQWGRYHMFKPCCLLRLYSRLCGRRAKHTRHYNRTRSTRAK